MKLKLKQSVSGEDWYSIVRAEHSNNHWWQYISPNSTRFMSSERLSPEASIEGNKEQMILIARAIQKGKDEQFKRIAVEFKKGSIYFSSPRNSDIDVPISIPEANELAAEILNKLAGKKND